MISMVKLDSNREVEREGGWILRIFSASYSAVVVASSAEAVSLLLNQSQC